MSRQAQAHGQTGPGRNASGNLPEASEADGRRSRTLAAVGTGYGARTLDKVTEVRRAAEDEGAPDAGSASGALVAASPADAAGPAPGCTERSRARRGGSVEATPR